MNASDAPFDRDLDLETLIGVLPRATLHTALARLLGGAYRLEDTAGHTVLAGPDAADAAEAGVPLRHLLDPVGTLHASRVTPLQLSAAASALEVMIDVAARLQMASDLHLQAVHEDYEALLQKHAALVESERRYKSLAAQLEDRVREQVATLERAQRQLYQTEKLAAVGQLAAGVAHEINNPVGFIRSNLNTAAGYVRRLRQLAPLVKTEAQPPLTEAWAKQDMDFVLDDFGALLEESLDGAARVAKIVADLKAFSSIDAVEGEPVDVNDNLRAVSNMIQPQLSERARLVLELAPLPPVNCHPGKINQVFLGLVHNAAQAIAAGGEIRIASRAGGGELRVTVTDDGVGIPAAILPRIFDPFFTTREVGKGTGLGLTVARDIVVGYGGRIDVHSAPGRGTVVEVIMPLS